MIRKNWPFILAVSAAMLLTSCLGSDDEEYDNSYTYYNDAGIVSFSLGTLKQYRDTIAKDGSDSTYYVHIVGSSFPFVIDHAKGQIYNPDSLPWRTDVSRVKATVTTRNSSIVYMQELDKDSLIYCDFSDSIDFRKPRFIRTLSLDGTGWRKYTINVNVHQQDGSVFAWNRMPDQSQLSEFSSLKAVAMGDSLYVFATDGTTTAVLGASRKDGVLTPLTPNINTPLTAEAHKGVVTMGGHMYFLNGQAILRTPDGTHYEQVAVNNTLTRLVAASRKELYAMTKNGGIVVSRDQGTTWESTTVDDNASLLPTDNFAYTCHAIRTNNDVDRVMLVGTVPGREYAVAWTKIADYNDKNIVYPWTFVDVADDNRYALKAYTGLTVTQYNGGALAFGTDTEGNFSKFLTSQDGGITWKTVSGFAVPDAFRDSKAAAFTGVADDDNYIWLVNTAGQVWRGRLNKLGWKR